MTRANCREIIRFFQSLALDVVKERAAGFDGELLELVDDLADELKISKADAAKLLHRPYRAALDRLAEVRA